MTDLQHSWVESANSPDTDFSLNNLPYGVFSRPGHEPRCGVAIGDMIITGSKLYILDPREHRTTAYTGWE